MAGWQNWPDVETDCEGVSLLLSSAVAAAVVGVHCTGLLESAAAAAADIHSNKTAALFESAAAAAAADIHRKKPAALFESAAAAAAAAAADIHSKKPAAFLHHFSVQRNSPPC